MELKDMLETVKGLIETQKTFYNEQLENVKKLGFPSPEVKEKLIKAGDDMEKVITDWKALQAAKAEEEKKWAARVDSLEATINRVMKHGGGVPEMGKSLGSMFAESAVLTEFRKGNMAGTFSVTVPVKGTLPQFMKAGEILGLSPLFPQALPAIQPLARQQLAMRSLIPAGRTTSGVVVYVQETSFTNNAAVVPEGGPKPQSLKTFAQKTANVVTIAHWIKISKQCWEDLPQLQSMIDGNLIYGIALEEDDQLLNGDGTGVNLTGLMKVAPAATAPGTGGTYLDAVLLAMTDVTMSGYAPTGIVTNPMDWAATQLLKTDTGAYIFANPATATPLRLWGLPTVPSMHMAAGKFLVGAFAPGCQIFDREEANVQVANQHDQDFTNNMLTVLGEERLAFVIYQPTCFRQGVTPAGTTVQAAASAGNRGKRE